ncbi:hypothetical protein AAC387_Pa04g2111 [Persea americana]
MWEGCWAGEARRETGLGVALGGRLIWAGRWAGQVGLEGGWPGRRTAGRGCCWREEGCWARGLLARRRERGMLGEGTAGWEE